MRALLDWLRARADDVAVALLTALFATFVIQIVSRYVLNAPVGWSVELCLTLWVWVVFWVSAFCVEDRDHIKFDLFYAAGGLRTRRIFALVSALAIAGGLLAALPATVDYITFYKIKKSSTLRIRLDYVFSIYGVFAVAIIVRYLVRAVAIVRGRSPDRVPLGHDTLLAGEEVHPR